MPHCCAIPGWVFLTVVYTRVGVPNGGLYPGCPSCCAIPGVSFLLCYTRVGVPPVNPEVGVPPFKPEVGVPPLWVVKEGILLRREAHPVAKREAHPVAKREAHPVAKSVPCCEELFPVAKSVPCCEESSIPACGPHGVHNGERC